MIAIYSPTNGPPFNLADIGSNGSPGRGVEGADSNTRKKSSSGTDPPSKPPAHSLSDTC